MNSQLLFLLGILVLGLLIAHVFLGSRREGFVNSELLAYPGAYPVSPDLLSGSVYPATGDKHTGDKEAADIWWQKPVFQVGSYKQITNNIQYPNSPDNGSCTPAEFCDVAYKNRSPRSNETHLSPAVPDGASRIGYFQNNGPSLNTFSNTGGNILY